MAYYLHAIGSGRDSDFSYLYASDKNSGSKKRFPGVEAHNDRIIERQFFNQRNG